MNQERKIVFPGKKVLIAALCSILSLVVLLALLSRILMLFDHYERYYEAVCYAVWGIEALYLGIVSRKGGNNPLLFIGAVAALVILFVLAVGLITGSGKIAFSRLGLHFALYVLIAFLVSLLPRNKPNKSGKPKRPAAHFKR